ncbi:UNVERIFIED_CONTAM: hypothetical protein O8I53_10195 [Campylobacter lari]
MKKNLDKEYKAKADEAVLRIKGTPLGDINPIYKTLFKNQLDDLDIKQLIHTVYLNNAKDVLLIGNELNYSYVILNEMTLAEYELGKSSINIKE